MAAVAIEQNLFAEILPRIKRLRYYFVRKNRAVPDGKTCLWSKVEGHPLVANGIRFHLKPNTGNIHSQRSAKWRSELLRCSSSKKGKFFDAGS